MTGWHAEYTQPHPQFYQQYLLYCCPQERFSVVSFVWGPGQEDAYSRPHRVGVDRHAAWCRALPTF